MSKKPVNYFNKFIEQIIDLKKRYPNQPPSNHISMAFADYGDIWGLSEKEMCFALEKYSMQLDMDEFTPDKDLEQIIEEGKNLDTINLYEEEEEDYE